MYNFEIEKPGSIAEAVAALGSEDAQALGGGQTLIPTLKARLASPSKLVSLAGVAEMQGIKRNGGALRIGGATGERLAVVAPSVPDDLALPSDVTVVGEDELAEGRHAWFHDEVAGRPFRISARSFFERAKNLS